MELENSSLCCLLGIDSSHLFKELLRIFAPLLFLNYYSLFYETQQHCEKTFSHFPFKSVYVSIQTVSLYMSTLISTRPSLQSNLAALVLGLRTHIQKWNALCESGSTLYWLCNCGPSLHTPLYIPYNLHPIFLSNSLCPSDLTIVQLTILDNGVKVVCIQQKLYFEF